VKEALKMYLDKTGVILLFVMLAGMLLSFYMDLYPAAAVFALLALAVFISYRQITLQSRNSNVLLYSALDGCPDGVLLLDTDLTCSYCNEQACAVLGLEASEIQGTELASLICNEKDGAALNHDIEIVERVMRTGGRESVFEATFYRKREAAFPVEYRVSAVINGQTPSGVLLFFQDVTAQRRIESLLNEKVDVLEGLEKRGKIGFWEWDIAKKELSMSKQFRHYLSYDLKEPVMKDSRVFRYIHTEDLPLFREKIRSALAGHPIVEITLRTLPQKGNINVLHFFGRTEYDQLNKPLKVNGFCFDVTEKTYLATHIKRLEQELKSLKNRPQLLERNPHSVDTLRFITGMSHDLRTPLNSILGFAQLHLQKSCESESDVLEQQNCHRIIESGKHLLQLISDVIDYAKIEAKELTLTIDSYVLAGIIRESLEVCDVEAKHREVALTFDPPAAEEVWVTVDRDRMRQALVNLLSHILAFCSGGEKVVIRYGVTDSGMVKIEIVDVNNVIPLDKVMPIFSDMDPQGVQRKMQEMELKLAIAKRLVEQMDCTLQLERDTVKGNVFSLQLKLGKAGENTITETLSSAQHVGQQEQAAKEYTILYIEDNAANRQLVKSVLKKNVNYLLLEAENGAAGLALAQEKVVHCILLDLNLPDMTGYQVIEDLKKNPLTSTIPVIALSGEVSPEEKEATQRAGFDSFIGKPINVAEFRQTVDRFLAR